MKRPVQRSKAELLYNLQMYEAMRKDTKENKNNRNNTAYFRLEVEWCYIFWKDFNMTRPGIMKFLQYVNDNDVSNLPEGRRSEINKLLKEKGCFWTLKNMADRYTRNIKNTIVDRSVRSLENHNTEVAVDYSLLALEFLAKERGFTSKELDLAMEFELLIDSYSMEKIYEYRNEIYEKKQIWFQLDENDMPDKPKENMQDTFGA